MNPPLTYKPMIYNPYYNDISHISCESRIVHYGIFQDEEYIVLESTPFFPAEWSHGSDTGYIQWSEFVFAVTKTIRNHKQIPWIGYSSILHIGYSISGTPTEHVSCSTSVDWENRFLNSRYHTAIDIIHCALRESWNEYGEQINRYTFWKNGYVEFEYPYWHALRRIREPYWSDNIVIPVPVESVDLGEKIQHPNKEELQKHINTILSTVYSPHIFYDSDPGRHNIRNVWFWKYGSCECNGIHVNCLWDIGSIIIDDLCFEDNIQKITFHLIQ